MPKITKITKIAKITKITKITKMTNEKRRYLHKNLIQLMKNQGICTKTL